MLTYFVAYSMEQNQFSVGQEIPPHFMEPEYSILYSQVPTACPYTEPAWSSPNPPHPTSWRSILILSSHLFLGLPSGLFASGFLTKSLYMPLLSPHMRYMLHPAHSSLCYHLKYTGWAVQIIQLLIMPLPPFPCHLISLRPKYSPQHPFLKHPQTVFLPQCQLPSFTPIQQQQAELHFCIS